MWSHMFLKSTLIFQVHYIRYNNLLKHQLNNLHMLLQLIH